MSVKQAASATIGLLLAIIVLLGWLTYNVNRSRAVLNDSYLAIVERTRTAEALADETQGQVNKIEGYALQLSNDLDKIHTETKMISQNDKNVLVKGLRAKADTLRATLHWLDFSLDHRLAQHPNIAPIMGNFDPYRLSISRLRRVAETWIIEGEALTTRDIDLFVGRLRASPHLKNIDIIETAARIDASVDRTYTTYRLSADIVVRPELTSFGSKDATPP